jgi:hypothetical protein
MSSDHAKRVRPGSATSKARRRYVRHRPEDTVLCEFVQRHHTAFFAGQEEQGRRVPGFVRVKCEDYRYEHLVAFSCEGRGFCRSCAARRMAETGAKLVDEVLAAVPYR